MEIKAIETTGQIDNLHDAMKFCQNEARICYSEKTYEEIKKEPYNQQLLDSIINNGHHSPFDHFKINYYFEKVPKILAMVFNNQRDYVTSEKSARYTQMKGIPNEQIQLYEKWIEIFKQRISEELPKEKYPKLYVESRGATPQQKLAQENARYLTSVFTPTFMGHTISLRQLNIIAERYERFVKENFNSEDIFKKRLAESMNEFVNSDEVKKWRIPKIKDKIARDYFFADSIKDESGKISENIYSAVQCISFACLAQSHRHRTLTYNIFDGWKQGAELGFFLPPIIKNKDNLIKEWNEDMRVVSKNDFPQGQLLLVLERGNKEDLELKSRERRCIQAQLETDISLSQIVNIYSEHYSEMKEWLEPECLKGGCKKGGCFSGPIDALERLI